MVCFTDIANEAKTVNLRAQSHQDSKRRIQFCLNPRLCSLGNKIKKQKAFKKPYKVLPVPDLSIIVLQENLICFPTSYDPQKDPLVPPQRGNRSKVVVLNQYPFRHYLNAPLKRHFQPFITDKIICIISKETIRPPWLH